LQSSVSLKSAISTPVRRGAFFIGRSRFAAPNFYVSDGIHAIKSRGSKWSGHNRIPVHGIHAIKSRGNYGLDTINRINTE